jgi:hypothetical protein
MKDADVDLCLEINQEVAGKARDIIVKLGNALNKSMSPFQISFTFFRENGRH